jgi:hypothetical protein
MDKMDTSQIRHLLAKYFEGNTTLEEERLLLEYFADEKEPAPELIPLKKQFGLFKAGRDLSLNIEALETKIIERIDKIEQQSHPVARKLNFTRLLVAASIAIILGFTGVIVYRSVIIKNRDTFTDPQLAYVETQKALLYISQKMNKGIEPLAHISKISTGSDKLKKLEKMDESLGMLNLVSFINQSSNLKK